MTRVVRATAGLALSLLGLGAAPCAFAQLPPPQFPVPLTVSGNQASGVIALPGGIGADLTIEFESVTGLTPTALAASASLVNPLDPVLLGRLPPLCSIPVAFPVLLHLGPSAESALSFHGVVTVSLHTYNLHLDPGVPLALDKAPNGGAFHDVTRFEGIGSYRVGGGGGGFSEFLISVDLRPIDAVIDDKFDALQATLTQNAASMPAAVAATLQARLSQARSLYESGALLSAILKLASFSEYVETHSGADIPDVWVANDPATLNVAGLLRSGADTLKFSLDRKLSGQP